MTGTDRIAQERRRQTEQEGWTKEHDNQHKDSQLAIAAACYAVHGLWKYNGAERYPVEVTYDESGGPHDQAHTDAWPWSKYWDKREKHSRVRQLEIAGALIAAEIDRITSEVRVPASIQSIG